MAVVDVSFWVVVSNIFSFLPLLVDMIQFDQYFSDGLKPPTRCFLVVSEMFLL